jgi:hypothetical protein
MSPPPEGLVGSGATFIGTTLSPRSPKAFPWSRLTSFGASDAGGGVCDSSDMQAAVYVDPRPPKGLFTGREGVEHAQASIRVPELR